MTEPPTGSRYERVSRRALLRGTIGAGVLAVVPGLACGNSDQSVFASTPSQTAPRTAAADPLVEPTSTFLPAPTAAPSVESTAADSTAMEPAQPQPTVAPPEPALASPVGAIPAGTELTIGFTYTQAAGGKNEPPYIAVWVEDTAGELIDTIALWFQQTGPGERWLPDLQRWNNVDGSAEAVATISSATRLPGAYALAWDGTVANAGGAPVSPGQYFICIESARERGPYSLIREPISLTGGSFAQPLPDAGELVQASVALAV